MPIEPRKVHFLRDVVVDRDSNSAFDLVHFMPLFGIVDGPLFGLDLGLFPPRHALFVQVNMVKYDILLKKFRTQSLSISYASN